MARIAKMHVFARGRIIIGPHWPMSIILIFISFGAFAMLMTFAAHNAVARIGGTLIFGALMWNMLFILTGDPGILRSRRAGVIWLDGSLAVPAARGSAREFGRLDLEMGVMPDGGPDGGPDAEGDDSGTVRSETGSESSARHADEGNCFDRMCPDDDQWYVSDGTRKCKKCRVKQPVGCLHCDACGVCVLGHDHHCVWLGKCIGGRNINAFYRLLVLSFGGIFYFMLAGFLTSN